MPEVIPGIGFEVPVFSDPDLEYNCCEYNCDSYIHRFGGEKIEGVYVLKHHILQLYQLVRHFIIYDGKEYIDITPFNDRRDKNYFIPVKINTYNLFVQFLDNINIGINQEAKKMYYVYCYIDPINEQPFYVGKGSKNRAYAHINISIEKNKNKTRFQNKLQKMQKQGVDPKIIFLAQNIQDEQTAYEIEESFIKKYGRKGYDGGILLNICEGSRPPNHKGKTYKEIYGDAAEEQRKKRHTLQLEAGGWFKDHKHSEETKRKYKETSTGITNNNSSNITEEELLTEGKLFCIFFNYSISSKKWKFWCEQKNIPSLVKTFRFNNRNILDVFVEKFNAVKKFDSMLWFHNPKTKQTWRCLDWELKYKHPPKDYIRGRGICTFKKRKNYEDN
jgi:hypothetical protein